jgi:hypothetical protein
MVIVKREAERELIGNSGTQEEEKFSMDGSPLENHLRIIFPEFLSSTFKQSGF